MPQPTICGCETSWATSWPEHHRLPRFVAFLDNAGIQTVTVAAAIAWANAPEVDPTGTMASAE